MSFLTLSNYLKECIKTQKIPGCVCWIGNAKKTFFYEAFGSAQIFPRRVKIKKNTIFDLASLTKPLVTALCIMKLIEEKELKLNNCIEQFIPQFKKCVNGKKTIKMLLTHTSGIPAWFPLYMVPAAERLTYLAELNTGKVGVIYSCLGYIILGMIIEKITQLRLDQYYKKHIIKNLHLNYTGYCPKNSKNIAATELGNAYEKNMAAQYGSIANLAWRTYLIKGEVHDGNCFYAFNGVAGNAGLFSNASDLATLLTKYLAGKIISRKKVDQMIKNYTKEPEKRGLGWVIEPYPGLVSKTSFSHTGFTGTMCLVDPEKKLIIILLANAIHPRVKPGIMTEIRKKVVEIAVKSTARYKKLDK